MRFDIFLSSLLFGITLLTCCLAITHLISGALLGSSNLPAPVRGRIRALLLGTSISLSLLLFLLRLSHTLAGGGSLFPRQVISFYGENRAPEQPEPIQASESTWTLYDRSTRELRAASQQSSVIGDSSRGVHFWVQGALDPECASWIDRARMLKLEPTVGIPSLSSLRARSLVAVCGEAGADSVLWDRLREHLLQGGSVLLLGRPKGAGTDEFQSMLRIRSWRDPEPAAATRLVFGGPKLSWGGFPSGLVLHLKGSDSNGLILADVPSGVGEAVVDPEMNALGSSPTNSRQLSALILDEVGQGRIAWTSLPARLHGILDSLHGPAWNLLTQRIFAHLLQAPQLGLEAWPAGERVPVIPLLYADGSTKEVLKLARFFAKRKIPLSAYLLMNRVESDRDATQDLLSQPGAEVAAAELDQQALPQDLEFFSRYDRMSRWLSRLAEIPRKGGRGSRESSTASRLEPGALTLPGSSGVADQLAALMANRFAYSLLDPFGTQQSPMRLHLAKTETLLLHLAEGHPLESAASLGSILVWPHPALDDQSLLRAASGGSELSDVKKAVLSQFLRSAWAGGPFLLKLSLSGLGSSSQQSLLEEVLDELEKNGAVFADAGSLAAFWEARSEVEVSVEAVDPARVPSDLRREALAAAAEPRPVSGPADSGSDEEAVDPEENLEELRQSAPAPISAEQRASKQDSIAYRYSIRNTSARKLEKTCIRMTEPDRYRLLVRGALKSSRISIPAFHAAPGARALATGSAARVLEVWLPELEPGQSLSVWVERKAEADAP